MQEISGSRDYNSKRSEKRRDIFWRRMQREIGDVAIHVQNTLNFQELSATKALGTLCNDDIAEIEQQMRYAATRVAKLVRNSEGSLKMSDFYGSFDEDPEHFTFSVGDVRVFQTVIDAVKQRGIHHFICETSNESSNETNATQGHSGASLVSDLGNEWSTLRTRIKYYYSNDSPDDVQLEQLIQSLDAIEVKPEIGQGGKIVVTVPCGKCTRAIKLVRDPPRSWPIFNLVRHFNRHININASDKNKRKKDSGNNSSVNHHIADPRKVSRQDNRLTEEVFELEDGEHSLNLQPEISSSARENVIAECSLASDHRFQTEYGVAEEGYSLNTLFNISPLNLESGRDNSQEKVKEYYPAVTHDPQYNARYESNVDQPQYSTNSFLQPSTFSPGNGREDEENAPTSSQGCEYESEVDEIDNSTDPLIKDSQLGHESDRENYAEYSPIPAEGLQHESEEHKQDRQEYLSNPSTQENLLQFESRIEYGRENVAEVSRNKQYESEFLKFIHNEQQNSFNEETLEIESPRNLAECTSDLNSSTFLDKLVNMHSRVKDCNIHSRRYDELEKDLCTFEYLTAGNAHYQYVSANLSTMSKKTIQRHMQQYTIHINEGVLDIQGLKKHLVENGYPLAITLCEDGTRIKAATEYDYSSDSVKGLVSDLDVNGLPKHGIFKATTPYHIAHLLKKYPVGNYAYVQVAVPLISGAIPYVLYHTCTNNKFEFKDVLNRWQYTETLLRREGITVVTHASDGDSRLMKAMKERAGFNKPRVPSPWGQWFRVDCTAITPINVQDMVHTINKLRNRLLNGDMKLGSCTVTKDHLKELVNNHSKDKHGLCMSDIELKDKMSFSPTLKLINRDMIEFLKSNVPNSIGTVVFLELMHRLHRSFIEIDVPLIERVQDIWISTFIIRAWRNITLQNKTFSTECITANAYYCIELNAHAILLFITKCRDNDVPEQCLISSLSSQPCEQLFREMRSMSTTNQTVVNFTIKEFTDKLKRIYMKRFIMNKNQNQINFPFIIKQHNKSNSEDHIPSNEDLMSVINKAQDMARQILISIGMESSLINMNDTVNIFLNEAEIEFVDLRTTATSEDELYDIGEYQNTNEHENQDGESRAELLDCNIVSANTTLDNVQDDPRNDQDSVYEAAMIFPNFNDGLQLKSCRTGNKHTFRIADKNGETKNIKKSTLLWMLTEGRHKLSTDRLRRFQQREKHDLSLK